jgi:CubicO group peptidase (beta-lactamase class C family)
MRRALVALILALPLVVPAGLTAQSDFLTTRFERYLDALRKQAGIPGLAGAIVQDDRIVWEGVWGYQDLEARIPTSPDTPFYIADLTGMLSATLVLQCIEQGKVDFDQTVSVPAALPTGSGPTFATVHDLLSHWTAGPNPFHYDPTRFAALTGVIEACTQDSLKEAIARRLLQPLAMTRSVPGQDVVTIEPSDFDDEQLTVYRSLVSQIAKPYRVDRRGRASLSQYAAATLDAASGLISTTRDLANFTIALNAGLLLDESTLAAAWTPASPARAKFGLGWFVQQYNGQPVVWHFGYAPDASSALFIHLPARHKTLILLANSDGLAAAFSLPNGDVTLSPYARLFLSLFG